MKKIKIAIVVAALLGASPAFAFSWQQFWTGHSTSEDSPLQQQCRTLEIGFLAAAPCMSKMMRYYARHPDDLVFADNIDVFADEVKAGKMTAKEAYAAFEQNREQLNRRRRARSNAQAFREFGDGMQRQWEMENAINGAIRSRCLRSGMC